MLEDSQLQILRLGESNVRHFEGSDLQILGFRCSKMEMSSDERSNKMLKKTLRLQKLLRLDCVPLDRRWFLFPNNFFPKQHSICLRIKPTQGL